MYKLAMLDSVVWQIVYGSFVTPKEVAKTVCLVSGLDGWHWQEDCEGFEIPEGGV